jgi:ATP-dependent helicase HrpB
VETLRTFASFRDFFPDFSEEGMLMDVENWLLPFLTSLKKTSDFQHLPIYQAVKTRLTWQQQQELDRLAPTHQLVPSGSKIRITYSQHQSPYLSVKLQEMFGASKTPCIADGQIPLVLHLLSPAMRPLQVTSNLETFWREVYPEVRKDLRGRYPKHSWPENPFAIIAHRGTKRNEEKLHE